MNEHMDAFFPRNRAHFDLTDELSRLHWTRVEELCERLLRRMHAGSEILAFNRNGTHGSDGADFVVLRDHGGIAYQVKAESAMSAARLRSWVKTFVAGRWRERCDEFVILSAIRPSPLLHEYYLEFKEQTLQRHGLRIRLEDPGWFDDRLCEYPEIVGRIFGPDAQLWYVDRVMLARAERESADERASAFRRFEVTEDTARCSDVGLHVECCLPNQRDRGLSASVRFAEPGMYDTPLSLGNDDLLSAFEEAEWRGELPFHVASSGNVDYLQVGNARVAVPRSTAQTLADAMRFLRDAWHDRIREVDERREAIGYQYLHALGGVKIGRIDSRLWQATLEFANAHTHDGDGPFDIFFDHHAYVQVFTSKPGSMRPGYHAQLQTVPIVESYLRPPDGNVDVVWMMPPALFDDCREFSRKAWWPVHMVTRWFEEELLPAVWSWDHRDGRTRWDKLRGIRHAVPEFVPANWWYSVRAPLLERRQPDDRESLERLITDLQRHYSMRAGTFPAYYLTCIDAALLRLLEVAELEHWDYVRSKGDFLGSAREEMLAELHARMEQHDEPASPFGLEWRLRTFKEICAKSCGHINAAQVEKVAHILNPLCREADRHNERLAHRDDPPNVFPK